jgi:hypothetical protein
MIVVKDPRGRDWVQAHPDQFGNLPLAPLEHCAQGAVQTQVQIAQPGEGSTVQGVVSVVGVVQMPDFEHYDVQYGAGEDPRDWGWISGPHLSQVQGSVITEWDTTHLAAGLYTLRVTAHDRAGRTVQGQSRVYVLAPTATATIVWFPTATETPTPEYSPTPTETPAPLFPTATPTLEPLPTDTPTVTSTPELATATPTPEVWPTLEPWPTLELWPTATLQP